MWQAGAVESWLSERTKETRAMTRKLKGDFASGMQAGVQVSAGELLNIDRLEAKLANRERIERVREQTRTRDAARPEA